jgi:3-phosphoshikimate 1-carboxyvinyltransferase
VPGDISSAAFFLVAACIVPRARLRLTQLGVNPTRTGILEVLSQVGASFTLEGTGVELNEPIADLEIQHPTNLKPFQIDGAIVPRLIDEIPVLAVLASQCDGVSSIRGAAELRVKESDRIELIACNLRAMGAKVETHPDGLSIAGPTSLSGIVVDAANDHRIAMAFAIAGLIAEGKTTIKGAESIRTSYPEFENHLRSLYIA